MKPLVILFSFAACMFAQDKFVPLFDGKSMAGWTHKGGGTAAVEDGAIHIQSKPDDPALAMVLSERSFTDLVVRLQFKILKGNSGVFVRTDPTNMAAYEIEVDEKEKTGGFWETGPTGRKWVTGPTDNNAVKAGEWNDLRAEFKGHHVTFYINGTKTMELADDTQGRLEGVIGLQAHGSKRPTDVWFRNIEVATSK